VVLRRGKKKNDVKGCLACLIEEKKEQRGLRQEKQQKGRRTVKEKLYFQVIDYRLLHWRGGMC